MIYALTLLKRLLALYCARGWTCVSIEYFNVGAVEAVISKHTHFGMPADNYAVQVFGLDNDNGEVEVCLFEKIDNGNSSDESMTVKFDKHSEIAHIEELVLDALDVMTELKISVRNKREGR